MRYLWKDIQSPAGEFPQQFPKPVLPPGVEHDAPALAGEHAGRGFSYAGSRSGDKNITLGVHAILPTLMVTMVSSSAPGASAVQVPFFMDVPREQGTALAGSRMPVYRPFHPPYVAKYQA